MIGFHSLSGFPAGLFYIDLFMPRVFREPECPIFMPGNGRKGKVTVMKAVLDKLELAFAAFGGFIGWFLGGFDGFLYALVVFVVMDYFTGVLAAGVKKELSSEVGFKGIAKKVCIFVLVGILSRAA